MIVTYDGKNFSGFERQKNKTTIQGELERALKTATKEDISVVGSGRTDAKVSAYCQPVHFDISHPVDKDKLLLSLNGLLPKEIRVLSISETTIHARYTAKRKTYLYKIYLSQIDLPLFADSLRINPKIDIKQMKKFVRLLVGEHDFAGFQSSGSPTKTTMRKIYSTKLKRKGMHLYFTITGNGFLYKMVRNIVGTMLSVGENKINLKELKPHLFIDFKSTQTAKPEFLYLLNVRY